MIRADFIRYFELHLRFARKYNIPLSIDRMAHSIRKGECPFACVNCESCPENNKKCVELRDHPSYAPNAMYFRTKFIDDKLKEELIDLIKRTFA